MLTSVWYTLLYNYTRDSLLLLAVADTDYKFTWQFFLVYLSSCLGQETAK